MSNPEQPSRLKFLPCVIRAKDAHVYLGMERNRFNREVKPHLHVAYDRLDLDEWWEEYKRRNGQLGALCNLEGEDTRLTELLETANRVCGGESRNDFAENKNRLTG